MHFENEWYGLFARICLFQENWDWNCADLIQADLTWHVHNIVHNEYAHFSLKSDVTCKHEIYQFKLWQKMWFINLTRERKYKHGRKYKATQEQKDIDDELMLMCLFLALLETDSHVDVLSDRYIALCGYPIGKMEIRDSSQISTTAPIFLYYNYFRQNIWVNILVHFHFQYIFVDSTTNNIRFNSRPCSRCWCYPSLSPIKEKFHKCPTHLVISVVVECIDIWVLTPVDCRHRSLL